MTQDQKLEIYKMRLDGQGYKAIAIALDLSSESIKKYCQRNHLQGSAELVALNALELEANNVLCDHCKNPIKKKETGRTSRFCTEACRRKWWSENRSQLKKSDAAVYSGACAHCGEAFSAYGNPNRKYCSRTCYFTARFGGTDIGFSETEHRIAHSC